MELTAIFQQHFGHPPAVIVRAPGRVNLLGEHVDYNDGLVLPAAIDRAVYIAAAPDEEGKVSLHALDLGESVTFRLQDIDGHIDIQAKPLPHWAQYPAGVAWALKEAGLAVTGLQAVFTSNIPIGSGLSSSAAVEVGFAVVWRALAGWQCEPLRVAQLCQRAENAYVGVSCGLMDQFASACGVEDHALCFDTRSLTWEPAPLPEGTAIVIADSGVRRSLATSAYNDRRAACEKAVAELKKFMPEIHSLRDVLPTEYAAYSAYLSPEVRKRGEHIVKEIGRVQSALSALHRQDKRAFGALMYAGHKSLRNLYEVSTPELDTLVELARDLPGAIGARLTGAGFGGCTVNLVEADQAGEFIEALKLGYKQKTGKQAQIYLCKASQGASVIT
ncbi:MAG: galactokinase [Chloroflexota bacterium]